MEATLTQPTPSQSAAQTSTEQPRALKLTERAVQQVKEVIKAQGFEGYFLTVRVVPSGCSGFGYDLNLIKDTKPEDLIWEQDGVRVATDPLSAKYLAGTEVDYVTTLQGAGFKFLNPNAKSSCGCGQSFST